MLSIVGDKVPKDGLIEWFLRHYSPSFSVDTNNEITKEVTKSLVHEIEHKALIENSNIEQQRRKYIRKEGIKVLGGMALVYAASTKGIIEGADAINHPLDTLAQIGVFIGTMFPVTKLFLSDKALRKIYLNRPDEKLCFEVEKNAPENIISIEFKSEYLKLASKAMAMFIDR
jgi:hypothetical protein